jgi:hypothetical protein
VIDYFKEGRNKWSFRGGYHESLCESRNKGLFRETGWSHILLSSGFETDTYAPGTEDADTAAKSGLSGYQYLNREI